MRPLDSRNLLIRYIIGEHFCLTASPWPQNRPRTLNSKEALAICPRVLMLPLILDLNLNPNLSKHSNIPMLSHPDKRQGFNTHYSLLAFVVSMISGTSNLTDQVAILFSGTSNWKFIGGVLLGNHLQLSNL